MKIHQINLSSKIISVDRKSHEVNFKAGLNIKLLRDIFVRNKNQGLQNLVDISVGNYGTQCKGSIPLTEFFNFFKDKKELENIIKKGLSTNTDGFAYSFLKTNANKPVSTSYVQDCSVIYLFNKEKNTHFLYHMYPQVDQKELEYMIRTFMKEGYTKAAIVPGTSFWASMHKRYLPMVFDTLKLNNPKATLNVYHNTSKAPEIVGYKGNMFQINTDSLANLGQATFKISDINVPNTLIKLHYANSLDELKELKRYFARQDYDVEIKRVLYELIDERQNEIKKIQSCKSIDALENFLSTKSEEYLNSFYEYNHEGYRSVIRDHSIKLDDL